MRYLKDTAFKFSVIAVALVALGAGVALAAGEDDRPGPAEQAERGATHPKREAAQQQFLTGVAGRLGVTVAELEAALKAETLDLLDQAVKDGKLSEERAARLRQAVEEGKLRTPFGPPHFGPQRFGPQRFAPPFGPGRDSFRPQGGPHGPRGHGLGALGPFEAFSAAAEYLGLEPSELVRELSTGKSLAALTTEQGKSVSGLKEALLEAVEARLNAAVAQGRLSKDEAAKKLAAADERLGSLIERQGPKDD